jgi:hypothetical protein
LSSRWAKALFSGSERHRCRRIWDRPATGAWPERELPENDEPSSIILLGPLERLLSHRNSHLQIRSFELVYNGFEKLRDLKVLRTFFKAFSTLHAL